MTSSLVKKKYCTASVLRCQVELHGSLSESEAKSVNSGITAETFTVRRARTAVSLMISERRRWQTRTARTDVQTNNRLLACVCTCRMYSWSTVAFGLLSRRLVRGTL